MQFFWLCEGLAQPSLFPGLLLPTYFCRLVDKICSLVTIESPDSHHPALANCFLSNFPHISLPLFYQELFLQIDPQLLKYIFIFISFLVLFASFPWWWKARRRTWYFSCITCALSLLFSWYVAKSTFSCCLSIRSDCFLAAFIFSFKASPSCQCCYLVASHTASCLLFPPWATAFWHLLLVPCQLLQPQENHCMCPLKKGFSQCFTTSVLITISPSITSLARFPPMPNCFLSVHYCSVLWAYYAEILPVSLIFIFLPCLFCYPVPCFFLFPSLTFCFYNAVYHVLLAGCLPNCRN